MKQLYLIIASGARANIAARKTGRWFSNNLLCHQTATSFINCLSLKKRRV